MYIKGWAWLYTSMLVQVDSSAAPWQGCLEEGAAGFLSSSTIQVPLLLEAHQESSLA